MQFTVRGKVWRYEGPGGWHFVSVGAKQSSQVKNTPMLAKVGWGNVPVVARIGGSEWRTTLFPTKEGRYLIAIKADVRRREKIAEGATVSITVRVV